MSSDARRIEAWYRDPTMTDALRVSLVIGDLDKMDREFHSLRDDVTNKLEEMEVESDRKHDVQNGKLDRQDGKLDRIWYLLLTLLVALLASAVGYIFSTAGG